MSHNTQVHHEEISGKDSNKKRFAIEMRDVEAYLKGKFCPTSEKEGTLPERVQQLILEQGLQPMIHTLYQRTSYVNKNDSSVRVTLDENVRVYRETGV